MPQMTVYKQAPPETFLFSDEPVVIPPVGSRTGKDWYLLIEAGATGRLAVSKRWQAFKTKLGRDCVIPLLIRDTQFFRHNGSVWFPDRNGLKAFLPGELTQIRTWISGYDGVVLLRMPKYFVMYAGWIVRIFDYKDIKIHNGVSLDNITSVEWVSEDTLLVQFDKVAA